MKKRVLLYLFFLVFLFNPTITLAAKTTICEYDYEVNMNYSTVKSVAKGTASNISKGYVCVADALVQGGSWVVDKVTGIFGYDVQTNPEWCEEAETEPFVLTNKVPLNVKVSIDGTMVGDYPKYYIQFSESCDGQKGTCDKTAEAIAQGGNTDLEGVSNFTSGTINKQFYTMLNEDGTCPDAAYIDVRDAKVYRGTLGNNEVCFGEGYCSSIKDTWYKSNTFKGTDSGYNVSYVNGSMKVINDLNKYSDSVITTYMDKLKEKYSASNGACNTVFQKYLLEYETYEDAKKKAAEDISAEIVALIENSVKETYPDEGEAMWLLVNARLKYLAESNKEGYDMAYIANKNFDVLTEECITLIQDDPTLTDEQRIEIIDKYNGIKEEIQVEVEKSVASYMLDLGLDYGPDKYDCEGFLGSTTDLRAPAYYLQVAMNIIKYLGVVLALVFSVVDFIKAITSQDNNLLQKATTNSVKRLTFAIIIFFLPILINFILGLVGAYSTCVS